MLLSGRSVNLAFLRLRWSSLEGSHYRPVTPYISALPGADMKRGDPADPDHPSEQTLFLLPDKFHRHRVDAVAQAGRLRSILEDVAEMGITAAADHFDASHK